MCGGGLIREAQVGCAGAAEMRDRDGEDADGAGSENCDREIAIGKSRSGNQWSVRLQAVSETFRSILDPAAAKEPARAPLNLALRIWSGFGLALVALIAVGVAGYRSINGLVERDHWVDHSRVVIENLRAVSASADSMLSDMRG